MAKKTAEEKKLEALSKLKASVAKQANDIMRKQLSSLTKELNSLLKSSKLWYCDGDIITTTPEMQTAKDRNADQMVIDHFTSMGDDLFKHVTSGMLWAADDISGK